MTATADCTTLAEILTAARNELLAARDLAVDFTGAGAGATCFLLAAVAALRAGSARRKAALRRDPRTPRMRARDRARVNLAQGARVTRDGAAHLVSSATRPGVVHRVEGGRCSCEAVGHCWHLEAAALAPAPRAARVAAIVATLRARQLAA